MPVHNVTRTALAGMLWILLGSNVAAAQATAEPFHLGRSERVVFIGNTFAERMQHFPHLEMLITLRQPNDGITFRNLGWSGDEVALQPRPFGFGDLHTHLAEQRPDVVFAAFGMNESFAGAAGLASFRTDLRRFLDELRSRSYGDAPVRVVLVSPTPHERVVGVPLDPAPRNRDLALYTEAMRDVAAEAGVRFVDLFTPMSGLMAGPASGQLTINGIHLNDRGYEAASRLMAHALGWAELPERTAPPQRAAMQRLRHAVEEKNELFFLRWRAVNGEYIYGRRREPFGVVDFPPEMRQLEAMIATMEGRIWALAREVSR